MKDGTRNRVTTRPFTMPNAVPTATPTNTPMNPRSSVVRLFKTDMAKARELAAMTPSMDRSIEPWMMMKVMPTAMTTGIAARLAIVCKFSNVAKLGSPMAKPRQRTTSAADGPHDRRPLIMASRRAVQATDRLCGPWIGPCFVFDMTSSVSRND
jgi:hypothetical protein